VSYENVLDCTQVGIYVTECKGLSEKCGLVGLIRDEGGVIKQKTTGENGTFGLHKVL
jgi:hypothetical protein